MTETSAEPTAIRSFHVDVPDEALDDLRRRVAATRFADKETVADSSQGAQLPTIQDIARYWATEYGGVRTGAHGRRS